MPATTTRLSDPTTITLQNADPCGPEATTCLAAYYQILTETIPALDPAMLPLPLPDADKYRPPNGAFLLATSGAMTLGCVSFRPLGPNEAEAKRLWVHPDARGLGLARHLMTAIEDRARDMGYSRMKMDSNSALDNAIGLYRRMGWTDCAPYSGFPADVWMDKAL